MQRLLRSWPLAAATALVLAGALWPLWQEASAPAASVSAPSGSSASASRTPLPCQGEGDAEAGPAAGPGAEPGPASPAVATAPEAAPVPAPSAPPSAGRPGSPRPPLLIRIDTARRTLTLFSQGRPYKVYPVAVGKEGTPTPVGEWKVVHKDKDWGNGFGTRWLGLNVPWGIYGIHGTNKPWSIGQYASAGCVRMHNRDVEELWDWVPLGTPVIVDGPVQLSPLHGVIGRGRADQDVVFVQMRLRDRGFLTGGVDGVFGGQTEAAVRELERFYGIPPDGRAGGDVLDLLGLER